MYDVDCGCWNIAWNGFHGCVDEIDDAADARAHVVYVRARGGVGCTTSAAVVAVNDELWENVDL